MNTIYTTNPRLDAIFNAAKDRKRILIVALDYAKSSHTALFTNGLGDQIRASFDLHNNREGCDFLVDAIKRTAKKRLIQSEHIIIVGEGFPSFARLFLANLQRTTKYELYQVHATDAKDRRPSNLASTDKSDLVGIAQCVLERRARSLHPLHTTPNYTTIPTQTPNQQPFLLRSYEELFADVQPLRELTRTRHRLVQLQTKAGNTIHALVDQLFPGFLAKKSPICAFTKASIKLLESSFSVLNKSRANNMPHSASSLQVAKLETLKIASVKSSNLPRKPTQQTPPCAKFSRSISRPKSLSIAFIKNKLPN